MCVLVQADACIGLEAVEVLFLFYSCSCACMTVCACGHMWVSGICLLCLRVTFVDFVSLLLQRYALRFNDAYILSPVAA